MQLLILKKFLSQRKKIRMPSSQVSTNADEQHVFSKDAAGVFVFLLVFFFLLMVSLFESSING
jgi:hypothetical protein